MVSHLVVELGHTNLYVAVEQTGKGGTAVPRVLEVEQVLADGIGRCYRHAFPAAACRDDTGYRLGERARHLLRHVETVRGTACIKDSLGKDGSAEEFLAAILRYLKYHAEQRTGKEYDQIVLVGVNEEHQNSVATAAAAAGMDVAASGFVDWLEAAIMDAQFSPPGQTGTGSSWEQPWLLVMDIGARFTGMALIKVVSGEHRLTVEEVARLTIPWGCLNVDYNLARIVLGNQLTGVCADYVDILGKAREEINQLVSEGRPWPGNNCVVSLPEQNLSITAADLQLAVYNAAQEGLWQPVRTLLDQARGTPGVLMVGGGSRLNMLGGWIREVYKLATWQPVEPELALVRGAVLSFALRRGRI